ncbi:renalase [Parasteatoda tepidariorum]|nr:renalase [Parasteatoda tepidariorum]
MTNIRLGIVGCGLTGVITAMLVKQRLPQISVMILEKSRATGGRMCTSKSSKEIPVDLGAQFITKTKNLTPVQENLYTELLSNGILEPLQKVVEGLRMTPSTVGNFVAPNGTGSIVKYFLQKSGCEALFKHRVIKVNSSNKKWILEYDNGSSHEFDAVVLTIPIPQILQLNGLSNLLQDYYPKLEAVEYCSRFALGLFYDTECDFSVKFPDSAKFFPNDPVIAYYSINHQNQTAKTTIVVHSTKEFGKSNIEQESEIVQNLIMDRLTELMPGLPNPSEIKFHKWRYSQVEKNLKEKGHLEISKCPQMILGGDGFTRSTFEGCILSAESIVSEIENNVTL